MKVAAFLLKESTWKTLEKEVHENTTHESLEYKSIWHMIKHIYVNMLDLVAD